MSDDNEIGTLVLRRKIGESFFIGSNVEITVVDCTSGWAKIMIKAPKRIKIVREEVIQRDFDKR